MIRTCAYLLSLAFIFVVPTEKLLELPGIGSLARIVGVFAMLTWLVSAALDGTIRKIGIFHVAVFIFVLWNAASYFWSMDEVSTLARIITWVQLALFVLLIWDLYTSVEAINAGLQAFVLGSFFAAGGTVYNFLNATEFVYGRYSAAGQHSVNLGLILAIGISVAWYLVIQPSPNSMVAKLLRLSNIFYLPVACIAIALTGSRGAMIAAIPAVFYIIGTLGRLQLWVRILFFFTAIVGGYQTASLVPQSSFDRLGSVYSEVTEGGNLTGRTLIWRDAIDKFTDHPLLGVGADAFKSIAENGLVAHNSFLSVLVELGLVGLFLFLAIYVLAFYYAFKQPRLLSRLWLTVMISWTLGVSALTYEHHKTTWLIFALIVAGTGHIETRVISKKKFSFYDPRL